jgi:GNAT superfamily N-acetyltransferase
VDYYSCPRPLPGGAVLHRLSLEEWKLLRKEYAPLDPASKALFGIWDLCVQLYKANAWALVRRNEVLTVNATCVNKRPKGAWGRYINNYAVYTHPPLRKQGWATLLQKCVEEDGRKQGCQRGRSMVMSYAGFRYHLALGHHFWGVSPKGELFVDFPLLPNSGPTPEGCPPQMEPGRCLTQPPHLLTVKELTGYLQQPPFKVSVEELKTCFLYRGLEYR